MVNPLPRHIEAFHAAIMAAGGQAKFGKICGCTQGNISQLKLNFSPLPAQYVLAVEAANLGFNRHDLRPDIYPDEADTGVEARTVLCSTCELRTDDPATAGCTFIDCPHSQREAA